MSKKLCSLRHGPFRLVDQVTSLSFKVTNSQGKLQKGSVHVNRMKQYMLHMMILRSTRHFNVTLHETHLKKTTNCWDYLQNLLEIEFTDGIFPNNSQSRITNHTEDLEEINPLPELTKSLRQKQKTKSS